MKDICEDLIHEQEALIDIIKSESKIAKCMSEFLCEDIRKELKHVCPVELRVELLKKILEAMACKECAMAEVINAVNCKMKLNEIMLRRNGCACHKKGFSRCPDPDSLVEEELEMERRRGPSCCNNKNCHRNNSRYGRMPKHKKSAGRCPYANDILMDDDIEN